MPPAGDTTGGGSGETLQSHVPSVFGAEHRTTRERHDAGCVNPIVLLGTRQCRSTATREVSGPQRRPLASAGGAVSCTISTAGHTGCIDETPGGCRPPRKTRLGRCEHPTTRDASAALLFCTTVHEEDDATTNGTSESELSACSLTEVRSGGKSQTLHHPLVKARSEWWFGLSRKQSERAREICRV